MTQEDKELLLKDLSARLPYECMLRVEGDWFVDEIEPYDCKLTPYSFMDLVVNHDCDVKPYLRPMSSMTEEEKKEMSEESNRLAFESALNGAYGICPKTMAYNTFNVDYCLSHHLDYRGLIEKGLALEAPEGMYKTE